MDHHRRNRSRARRILLICLLAVTLAPAISHGQANGRPTTNSETAGADRVEAVTLEQLNALQTQLEAETQLDEEARKAGLADINQAKALLKQVETAAENTRRFRQLADGAAEKVQQIQQQREQNPYGKLAEIPQAIRHDIPALEQQILQFQTERQQFENNRNEADAQVAALSANRTALPGRIAQIQQQITEAREDLSTQPDSETPTPLAEARRISKQARLQALEAQLAEAQVQQSTLDSRLDLRQAQQKIAADRVSQIDAILPSWRNALEEARLGKARAEINRLRQRADTAQNPLVAQAWSDVLELAEQNMELSAAINSTQQQIEQITTRIEQIASSFEQARFMEQQQGLSGQVGQFLRRQKQDLPRVRTLRRSWQQLQLQEQQARQQLRELRQQLDELPSPAELDELAEQEELSAAAQRELTRAMAEQKRKLEQLTSQTDGYPNYIALIAELEKATARELALVEEFRDYIDQRVLWVRSTDPLNLPDATESVDAALWLVSPSNWTQLGQALASDAAASPVIVAVGVALIGAMIVAQRRARSKLIQINQRVAGQYPGPYRDTVLAMALTLVLAAFWPVTLGFVGWRLVARPQAGPFAYAVGSGLLLGAMAIAPVQILRQAVRRNGLAEAHFRWPEDVLRRTSTAMIKLTTFGLILVVLIGVMGSQPDDNYRTSLGRLLSIAALLLLTIFLARLLKPTGPLIQETIAKRKNNWMYRMRKVWYPLVLLLPLSLAVAAAAGYYYTTVQLSSRLLTQAWVVVALILINALLLRWILLGRRRLALAEIARRKEAKQQREKRQQEGELPPDAPAELEEPPVDLSAVNLQTRQFVRYLMAAMLLASIWFIWAEVLPALAILDRIQLWSAGDDSSITLATLLGAISVVVLTVVLSRNLPGMMDIIMLQRLQLDSGSRFAVNAIFRYVIFVAGFVIAFQTIGLKWSHVQWLVAAMTVGLGFGLQEIFANFVSGLIILLERPIRVGDIVTVGDVTGTVSRIRMRATTITDFDRKELIVPNKEFITAQLVNWTLSDNVIRVVVPVGIAYGSDTDKAMSLLRQVADRNSRVLKEPEPMILFTGFGASSLDFELRAYVGGLRDFLAGRSELHFEVDQAFRNADIEISFPQRDIHIRSIESTLSIDAAQAMRMMKQRPAGPDAPAGNAE